MAVELPVPDLTVCYGLFSEKPAVIRGIMLKFRKIRASGGGRTGRTLGLAGRRVTLMGLHRTVRYAAPPPPAKNNCDFFSPHAELRTTECESQPSGQPSSGQH